MRTEDINNEIRTNLSNIYYSGSTDEGSEVRPHYKDGTPAYTKFITQVVNEYDLTPQRFSLPSLYHVPVITGIREIRWIFQKQSSSLLEAEKLKVNWWKSWDVGNNTIGKRYGETLKKQGSVDRLLKDLKENPFSRRHIISLWDEEDFKSPGLYPCAFITMWSVRDWQGHRFLDMTLIQRSSDSLVAKIINSSQYVSLQMMIAHSLGYKVGKFMHVFQNLHYYDRHEESAIRLMNSKDKVGEIYMAMKDGVPQKSFYDYTEDDFTVVNTNNLLLEKLGLEVAI